ncbi:MAG: AAA family ATPase [Deltaproteobacteria bacterium]|nr:AAA family ATPase [Deltaproteobacteria bacterium]MBN2674258.1 AAA family ATPase [Deltaproteobacteria bacterium]
MIRQVFEYPIFGRVDLDGTHRVIIETIQDHVDFPSDQALFLRLNCNQRECGAVVNGIKVKAEQNRLLVDRYKLQHLGIKDGERVEAAFFTPANAAEASFSAASEFSKRDLVRLIGKPFIAGEKSAVFTFSGEARLYTVESTAPEGIALITARTILTEAPSSTENLPVSYKDIGGLDEEIRLIRESIEYPFKHRDVFAHLGVKPPKGIILHGPPGTGKTLIAKALANEIGANYYTISGPEIYSKWYGNSEQRLRNIFNEAVKNAPSIVVIDELDSLVPRRDKIHGDQEQRIVATFLTQMDGLKTLKDVVVVGTTNRVNEIDPALRRSGRFEQEIFVGVPNHHGRKQILEIHTSRMPLSDDVDLQKVAELAGGFTGADLCSLCREAAYVALRRTIPEEAFQKGELSAHKEVFVVHDDFIKAFTSVRPSASKEYTLDVPQTDWQDIGGLAEVKKVLVENFQFAVKKREAFEKVGIRAAGGILLFGPPGTGKTLLARAVASECDVNFIGVKASDIRDKWIGESEEKIRNIFQKARLLAPCVIFFDEIDTMLTTRGRDMSGVGDAIVNQILSEMDGLEEFGDIFIMGATNRVTALDPAVLRPGRFDYLLEVPLPNKRERLEIFQVHLRGKPLCEVDFEALAEATPEFSGARIAEVCREAAWHGLRESNYEAEQVCITMNHLQQAISRLAGAGTR